MTTRNIHRERSLRDRSITTRFLLDDTAQLDRHGDEVRFALELTTHHDKESKRYVSRADRVQIGPVLVRYVIDFREPPPLPARTVPAPRYNAHALDQAHLAFEAIATGDTLERLLAWAAAQTAG